jgi:hypothetical protein
VLRIRDVYPGSRILIFTHPGSQISDPESKNNNKREKRKKLVVIPFFVARNFTNLTYYFIFQMMKEKIWAKFQRIIELFTQKVVTRLSGLGSGKKPIPDPGVKKAPDPGSRTLLTESILEVPGLEAEEHGGEQHEEAVVEQQSVLTQLLQVNNDFMWRNRVVTIV